MSGPFPIIAPLPSLGGVYPAQPTAPATAQGAAAGGAHVGEPGAGATSPTSGPLPGERRSTVDGRR